jgi:hypothetical protein
MVLTVDSRIFSFCKCLDKQIASGRKIQMEDYSWDAVEK